MSAVHNTKGIDIIGLVKTLKVWRRANQGQEIPGLIPEDLELIENTLILPVGWYPHEQFLRLLDACCQLFFNGTHEGMRQMGRIAAQETYTTVHSSLIFKGDINRTLKGGIDFIKAHFDFGEWTFDPQSDSEGQIRISDYPEMSEVHGHLFVGWCEMMVELCGGKVKGATIHSSPWLGDGEYLLSLTW